MYTSSQHLKSGGVKAASADSQSTFQDRVTYSLKQGRFLSREARSVGPDLTLRLSASRILEGEFPTATSTALLRFGSGGAKKSNTRFLWVARHSLVDVVRLHRQLEEFMSYIEWLEMVANELVKVLRSVRVEPNRRELEAVLGIILDYIEEDDH